MTTESVIHVLSFVLPMAISYYERHKGNYQEAYWWLAATGITTLA